MKDTHKRTPSRRRADGDHHAAEDGSRVGFGKPPRDHRFKKGQSGNPRGKRKGTPNVLGVFKKVVTKKVEVRVAGEVRKMTIAEYILRANYMAAALKRDQKAMSNMLLIAEAAGHLIDADDPARTGAPIAQSQALSTDEFEALFGNALPPAHRSDGTTGSKH